MNVWDKAVKYKQVGTGEHCLKADPTDITKDKITGDDGKTQLFWWLSIYHKKSEWKLVLQKLDMRGDGPDAVAVRRDEGQIVMGRGAFKTVVGSDGTDRFVVKKSKIYSWEK